MRQYVFSHDAEEAAKDFASAKTISFNMIPHDLRANAKFWVKLVELDPNYIAKVPQEVLDSESFAGNVSHKLFYRYLPKKYLTVEDFNTFRDMPEKAISVTRNPVELSKINEYVWYLTNEPDEWMMASIMDKRMLLYLIQEGRGAERINSELWSQEFADYLWESRKAMVSFDFIPKQFVRDEWMTLMTMYKEKRYPVFGNGGSILKAEKIPEYWGSFKTEEEMKRALDCEDLILRCDNPWGYAVRFEFNPALQRTDYPEIFSNLWNAISAVAANNEEILKRMYELYGSHFSKAMPRELFNIEWLIESDELELYVDSYKHGLWLLKSAECEVEKLEAEDRLKERLDTLKKAILRQIPMSDEELEKFISSIV